MEGGIKEVCGGEELFKDKIHSANKDIQLQRAKAEMLEVRGENQRLKKHLSQVLNDYKTLQKQFNGIVGQEGNESTTYVKSCFQNLESEEDSKFVSLSLGRTSSAEPIRDEKSRSKSIEDKKDSSLGLYCNLENTTDFLSKTSSENNIEVVKEHGKEKSPRHNATKTKRSEEEEASPNPAKRARVSVRVRCDTPTMNDGCQWRKYGQKVSKGNPCPRAYYRCTVGPSCSARKQVQRCIDDMSILITTYEGTHNHSLPISATVMASATSAAASMLLSGSSTSSSSLTKSSPLHGINYYLSDNSRTNQLYLSPSCPTVTLDLTSASSASHFNKLYSNLFPTPEYNNSSTNLSFSSLEANPWSMGTLSCHNSNLVDNSLNFARSTPHESYHQYLPKTNSIRNPQQQTLAQDNIAVATKAITSDPSFQSALVTAISSIIGNRGSGGEMIGNQIGNSNKHGQNLKFGEDLLRIGTQIGNRYKL